MQVKGLHLLLTFKCNSRCDYCFVSGCAEASGTMARHGEGYLDECHLCYETRLSLRDRFPGQLGPGQVYGVGLLV